MERRWLRATALALALVALVPARGRAEDPVAPAPRREPPPARIETAAFLGEVRLPAALRHQDTALGGLSGLTFDAVRGHYLALSGDRSPSGPARFCTLTIDAADGHLDPGDVAVTGVTALLDPQGQPFPPTALAAQGIALAPDGQSVFIASGGNPLSGPSSWVKEFGLDGQERRTFALPERHGPAPGRDVRSDLALEGLTLVPGGRLLVTATESALERGGPTADLGQPVRSRLLFLDLATGRPVREAAYEADPVAQPPAPPGALRTRGLSALLALDGQGTFLVLERSLSQGAGVTARLIEASTAGASDTLAWPALSGVDGGRLPDLRPAWKETLFSIGTLGLVADGLESLALGPVLPDGRRLLVLMGGVSSSPEPQTQVLAFAITFRPATAHPPAPTTLRGVVRDETGQAVAGAKLRVEAEAGRAFVTATAGIDGRFDVPGGAPEPVRWWSAEADGHVEASGIADPLDGDLQVRLPRAFHGPLRLTLTGDVPPEGTEVIVTVAPQLDQEHPGSASARVAASTLLVPSDSWPRLGLPAGPALVNVLDCRFAADPVRVVLPPAAPEVSAVLELRTLPTGRIRGRVVDESGQPVAGARVLAWSHPETPWPWEDGRADAEGRFDLSGLTPGVRQLTALGESPERSGSAVARVDGEEARITAYARRSVGFLVRDLEASRAGRIQVRVRNVGNPQSLVGLWQGGRGRGRLPPGTYEAFAWDRPMSGSPVRFEVSALAPASEISLPAPPVPGRLRGVVLGPQERPLQGVRVLLPDTYDPQWDMGDGVVETDAQGRFELPAPPETAVRVRADGGAGDAVVALGRASDEPVVLRLPGRMLLRGLGRSGSLLRTGAGFLSCWHEDPLRLAGAGLLEADGRLLVEAQAGSGWLCGWTPSAIVWPPLFVRGEAGSTLRGLALSLVPGAMLEGTLLDAEGSPLDDARVSAQNSAWTEGEHRSLAPEGWRARTDAQGRFRLSNLFPGPWTLRITRPDWPAPRRQDVEVRWGSPNVVVLSLPADSAPR